MSPEALKRNIYTVKNDIWSVGIMLYELLHGETPWECRTEHELMDKMVKVPVTFKVAVSDELKTFIKSCLEVDETHRMGLGDLRGWTQKDNNRRKSMSERPKHEASKQPLEGDTNRIHKEAECRQKSVSMVPVRRNENLSANIEKAPTTRGN